MRAPMLSAQKEFAACDRPVWKGVTVIKTSPSFFFHKTALARDRILSKLSDQPFSVLPKLHGTALPVRGMANLVPWVRASHPNMRLVLLPRRHLEKCCPHLAGLQLLLRDNAVLAHSPEDPPCLRCSNHSQVAVREQEMAFQSSGNSSLS